MALSAQYRVSTLQETAGENIVDAALVRQLSTHLAVKNILNAGQSQGVGTATLGTQVIKNWWATGFTTGKITQIEVTVQAEYPSAGTAVISNQPTASGPAALDADQKTVGLLFVGSDAARMLTPAQTVMNRLNVTIA